MHSVSVRVHTSDKSDQARANTFGRQAFCMHFLLVCCNAKIKSCETHADAHTSASMNFLQFIFFFNFFLFSVIHLRTHIQGSTHGRKAVCMLPVPVYYDGAPCVCETHADAHGREAVCLSVVLLRRWNNFCLGCAHADAHGREAVFVHVVPVRSSNKFFPHCSHAGALG